VHKYRLWFYAAAIYNFLWGTWVVLFPLSFFRALGMVEPNYPGIWQSVGMIVQVYAIGYWLVARDPKRYAALVWVGLVGKTFGPIGFLFAAIKGELPWRFGLTILTNDLIWWPAFWMFALKFAVKPMQDAWKQESAEE
jgi:small multidrug resistance pump